jgi:hypothetical protein
MMEDLASDRIARYILRVVPDAGKLTARTQMQDVSFFRMVFSRARNTAQEDAFRQPLRMKPARLRK